MLGTSSVDPWIFSVAVPVILAAVGWIVSRSTRAFDKLRNDLLAHMAQEAKDVQAITNGLTELKGQFHVNEVEHLDFERRLNNLEARK